MPKQTRRPRTPVRKNLGPEDYQVEVISSDPARKPNVKLLFEILLEMAEENKVLASKTQAQEEEQI